ncbi:MmcQ/YjbR family DNA-binding protein [Labedella populi]|uniref:MmcQ/YjbR family DNA-binding protein n=1 Tax=Labedella populi TaxID=2498850 RepID=A0A3S3ZWI1_9MICO|nr:MmcQ/YjbR family DNA-binding protein [Labedella populi]RWZ68166.1 MmcQ/YjbR family DNA-binding protein [Labedella populi]
MERQHPMLFEEGDPIVERVRGLCAPYPESAEVMAWGRPTFRAGKKIFVTLGSSMNRPHSIVVKPEIEERRALIELPRVFIPPYFGPGGWIGMDVDRSAETDWALVAELIDASYRRVALKRQIAALDAHPVVPVVDASSVRHASRTVR